MARSMGLRSCITQVLKVSFLIRGTHALPQQTPNDIVKSRDYTIQHCSLLAPQVQNALENLYNVLPPAIWETHYGVASAPYQAFFKNSYYETIVDHVLSSISIGAPFLLDPLDLDHKSAPSLVCALKPDTVIVEEADQEFDIHDVCKQNPAWVVMYYPKTSNIFICPVFFLMPTLPPAGNCPTVNETTNQFEGNFTAFWQSQMYILLHEIAHLYIGTTVEDSLDEVMDWNYAISLSPNNATFNALNYVLYVASVDKECEEFPETDQSHHSEYRRLGAMLDLLNTSSLERSGSQDTKPVRNRVLPYHTDAMNMTLASKNATFLR